MENQTSRTEPGVGEMLEVLDVTKATLSDSDSILVNHVEKVLKKPTAVRAAGRKKNASAPASAGIITPIQLERLKKIYQRTVEDYPLNTEYVC